MSLSNASPETSAELASLLGSLRVERVLIGEDEPRVVICSGPGGRQFLALLAAESAHSATWLYVEVTETGIAEIERGLPLRDAVLLAQSGIAYVANWPNSGESEPSFEQRSTSGLPVELLPPPSARLSLLSPM